MKFANYFFSCVFAVMVSLSTTVSADYETGLNAAQSGDFETAHTLFLEAAEAGLDLAQYNLGVMYYSGLGVKRDYKKAYEWTKKAADQGHVEAQFNMGTLYFNGNGTRRNRDQAFQWYMQAANNGHPESQYNLATMYRDGTGVKRDYVQAHFWANVSRENEYLEAELVQQEISAMLNAEQKAEAEKLFVEWLLAR